LKKTQPTNKPKTRGANYLFCHRLLLRAERQGKLAIKILISQRLPQRRRRVTGEHSTLLNIISWCLAKRYAEAKT